MAEKPKFIYVDKKNELVWEVPGLGSVSFRDERHPKGAHGEINAYFKNNGRDYKIGWLQYTIAKNPNGKDQMKASQLFVNDHFRRMGIGTLLYSVAESKSPGDVIHQNIFNPITKKISNNMLYEIKKDSKRGFQSMGSNRELEKWLKTAPRNILVKKRIKRR